jgi:uncharacterized protein
MIFVDTGAFLARHTHRDQNHRTATTLWRGLETSALITTNHVLDETLTLLGRRIGHRLAGEVAEMLFGSERLDVIYTSREDEYEALGFFSKFADQRISFTDCISFGIMKRNRISTAFTFDRHFRDAGFNVIGLK